MGFLSKILGAISGNGGAKVSEQLLFDKIIGFRGIVPGVGTSTLVQNVAIALSLNTRYSICVVDANFLYPVQYPMLTAGQVIPPDQLDYLKFAGDISEVVKSTNYKRVHLLSLYNRTIIDMMSSLDSEETVISLVGSLKSYFDIVLVDLSSEPTSISTHLAIKCNRIVNVADHSLKCIYNLRKSINTMATLAVPLAKANLTVFNKVVPDVLSRTREVIEESGLKIVAEIPMSRELAVAGISGKALYGTTTTSPDVAAFLSAIDKVVDALVQPTPLNVKYLDNTEEVEESTIDLFAETNSDLTEDNIEDSFVEDEQHREG